MSFLLAFTHSHDIPNLYDIPYLSSAEHTHKIDILKNVLTVFVHLMIVNGVQNNTEIHWIFIILTKKSLQKHFQSIIHKFLQIWNFH